MFIDAPSRGGRETNWHPWLWVPACAGDHSGDCRYACVMRLALTLMMLRRR
jgi:hypothetical protein